MNLCLRPKAVDVVTVNSIDAPPPVVPEDPALNGHAAEIHRQLSHMKEPIIAPRDQFIINLDFSNEAGLDGSPRRPRIPHRAFGIDTSATMNPAMDVNPRMASAQSAAGRPSVGPFARASEAAEAVLGKEEAVVGGGGGSRRGNWVTEPFVRAPEASTSTKGSGAITTSAGPSGAGGSCLEGQGPQTRGFVRVKSIRAPEGLSWTHSRKCLEVLLAAERGNRGGYGYLSHEQRLRERLDRLNLEMVVVEGDGNCQFRSISNELYGTQDHHIAIRHQAVLHITSKRDAFEAFLGEDFDQYVRQMERSGTWGDELTLRAVCDSFGITVHVVTSEEEHWYLTYEPEVKKSKREIFVTYIAPIHYNSIRRRASLKTMALSMTRSFVKITLGVHTSGGGGGEGRSDSLAAGSDGRNGCNSGRGGGSCWRNCHLEGEQEEASSDDDGDGGGTRDDGGGGRSGGGGGGDGGDGGGVLRLLFRKLSP